MKKNILLLFLGITWCFTLFGQGINDTIIIDEIIVNNTRTEYFNDGAKKEVLDSSALFLLPSSTMGDVLLSTTPALLKSYGHSGAAATISLRGGGSNRTQVLWEGIPINSITMGDTDLSLIPSSCFNYVAIDHSGSGTNYGSGTFGGAIQLSHTPQWKKHRSFSIQSSEGSFSTKNNTASHSIGNKKIESKGAYFYSKSKGDFPYYDYVRLDTFKRANANYNRYGFMQNVYYKPSQKNLLSAGIWYSVKDGLLPGIVGSSSHVIETQLDSSLRVFVQFKQSLEKGLLIVRSAYINDYQLYTKKLSANIPKYFTYSEITNTEYLNSITYRRYITPKLQAHIEYQNNILKANVDNYDSIAQEKNQHFVSALKYSSHLFNANIAVRQEYKDGTPIPFIYNIGGNYDLKKAKSIVRVNHSKKYRTPTFNDLYWRDWGNPNLKPEYGYSSEIGIQTTLIETKSQNLVNDITYFRSSIKNMIIWSPNGAVWNPINLLEAKLNGFEYRIKHYYKNSKFNLKNFIGVDVNTSHVSDNYNLSADKSVIGHQLYYVPKISFIYSPSLLYKNWYFSLITNWQSKRFYEVDKSIDAYYTIDTYIKYQAKSKKTTVNYSFNIKNITAKNYELIRSYPMPGRYFEFGIQLIFNK